MASRKFKKTFRRNALTVALGMCFVGMVHGQAPVGAVNGQAAPGDTITITNPATGFSRTVTASDDGSYRFAQLPIGQYTITRTTPDGSTSSQQARVNAGTAANIDFIGAGAQPGAATTLDTITVVASQVNPIDVSSVESTTILTDEQIRKIPVSQDTTSVALLAPGTVRGDPAFNGGNLASFGGASVAENQYYVNGFNITNTFQNLDFADVPFEAIAEQQVKTGGYGAEFGRSTGGVVNQITKRGTNTFTAGGKIEWRPEGLKEEPHNEYLNDGTLVADNSKNIGEEWTASAWAGGALIKDRLFAYGLIQYGESYRNSYPDITDGGFNIKPQDERPNWLVKLDWNINDSHRMELTALSDKRETETDYFETTYAEDGEPQRGAYKGTGFDEVGGETYILKYTGYLTDNFTISALAGQGESERSNYSVTAEGVENRYFGDVGGDVAGCPIITDGRAAVVNGEIPPITGCTLESTLGRPDAKEEREQYRLDAEWVLGDHILRGGVDIDNFESVAGESYSGGASYLYDEFTIDGVPRTDVARKRVFQSGATVKVEQQAYYVEDSWSITDNFIGYLGLRWDTFENINGQGDTFNKIEDQFSPRLGFSWDVFGDSTFKVFGNAGRYALPLTATVGVRGASTSLYSEQFVAYDGVDPITGEPLNQVVVTNPNNGREIRYLNNEFGVPKDARTIAMEDLDPMYQDEYILGFQKSLSDAFSVGLRGIYRDLKAAIDDTCDYRPIVEWALDNGFTDDGGIFITPEDRTQDSDIAVYNPGFPFCRLYNPGENAVFNMDVNGDGTLEQIPVAADVLGPDAKRKYTAVEFFAQGNWEHGFLQGSYTYAKSKGNTEGGVKSDIGQDDTNVTQDFDYPELAIGSYGYLPNDRRHTLKLFGNWQITDEWSVGANLLVQSGRPVNCFGYLGGTFTSRYGNSYFSCDESTEFVPRTLPDGSPNPDYDGAGDNGRTVVPRGTAGRLPWTRTLDLQVEYAPLWLEGFSLKVDVLNVFNEREVITVEEAGEDGAGNPQPNVYKRGINFQRPREVILTARYEF